MEALDQIKDIKISDNIKLHVDDSMEQYYNYIKLLENLSEKELKAFLRTLMKSELINNQEKENEPSLLMEFESELEKNTSIEMLANIINKKKNITLEDIIKIHKKLLLGTSDDQEKNYPYRYYPTKVGRMEGNVEIISYIPPLPDEVILYMEQILEYYNNDSNIDSLDVFLRPIIIHAYLVLLQPFGNGNSRLARLIQYGKIFELTNKFFQKDFKIPIMYLSKNYLISGRTYRGYIGRIAEFHNDDVWNKWFQYNLNMIDEQLYYLKNNLESYCRRRIK